MIKEHKQIKKNIKAKKVRASKKRLLNQERLFNRKRSNELKREILKERKKIAVENTKITCNRITELKSILKIEPNKVISIGQLEKQYSKLVK